MRGEAAIKRVRRWQRRRTRSRNPTTGSVQARSKTRQRRRRRTSWTGWRIVAFGVLLLMFGSSFLTQSIGPSWFALLLVVAGLGLVVYGRQR